MGHRLQDLDSMVEITMAIKREVDDAKSIREASAKGKKKESQSSTTSLAEK